LEIAVPGGKPQLLVEHRHTISHIVEGNAQLGLGLADLVEQPRIFHGNDGLRSAVLHQCNLFISKWTHLLAVDYE